MVGDARLTSRTCRPLRDVVLVDGVPDAPGRRLAVHDLEPALAAHRALEAPHPTRADDPAYLVYTSGTTGYPKGVLHAHRALLGRQPSSEYWFDFDPAATACCMRASSTGPTCSARG